MLGLLVCEPFSWVFCPQDILAGRAKKDKAMWLRQIEPAERAKGGLPPLGKRS